MDFTELETLAQTLASGFEALLAEVRTQRQIENVLRDKIAYAAREYADLYNCHEGKELPTLCEVRDHILQDPANSVQIDTSIPLKDPSSSNPEVESAWKACKTLRTRINAKEDVHEAVRKCPANQRAADQEDFEHDFTTPGVQGNLECPFAKMTMNGLPHTPNSTIDPIAAEFHQDKISVTSPGAAAQAAGQCPIRFLDQHSPEEVAKYFENHKHEIPRSHEICVKRYQANESSIRQLDEKYGNLVNMIQGLGVKHKQYLPEKDGADGESEREDHSSVRAVEKWAESIRQTPEIVDPEAGYEADEERTGHFEKPLREIRVGESPTRPWGIRVPLDDKTAHSTTGSGEAVRTSLSAGDAKNEAAAPGCPFGHGKKKQKTPSPVFPIKDQADDEDGHEVNDEDEMKPNRSRAQSNKAGRHQIVFNGPIVLGYSPEQAMAFLQALKDL